MLASYLFSLPEPIIPFAFYQAFRFWQLNDAITPPEKMVRHYQVLLARLPRPNRDLLLFVLDFYTQLHDRRDYRNSLMFRFTPAMVRERPRPVRDRRRQILFLPKHNHQPTVLYLIKIRGRLTEKELAGVAAAASGGGEPLEMPGQGPVVTRAPAPRRNSTILDVLRGKRRPSSVVR